MAHFAEIDINNIVLRVVVINDNDVKDESGNEVESVGAAFCKNLFGGTWLQTSYNGNIRKNFASIGSTYDSQRDAFIPVRMFASWTLNETTCKWQPPTEMPDDGAAYDWDEDSRSWVSSD